MTRENQHIVASLPQRRNLNRKDRQTKVQVFAKLTLGNALFQIAVGRGDDAGIDVQ